jgi:hypothetical protein
MKKRDREKMDKRETKGSSEECNGIAARRNSGG